MTAREELDLILGRGEPNDPRHTLKVLQRLNLQIDEIMRDSGIKLEEMRSRVETSALDALTARLDMLASLLAQDSQVSLQATQQNVRLQIEMIDLTVDLKRLTISLRSLTIAAVFLQ